MLTAAQLAALKAEVTSDPLGLGYADPLAEGAYQTLANILNLPAPGQTAKVYQTVPSPSVVGAIVKAEWKALGADDRAWLAFLVSQPYVDATVPQVRADLADLFGPATTSRANLVALAQRPATRAEQIGLPPFTVITVGILQGAMDV